MYGPSLRSKVQKISVFLNHVEVFKTNRFGCLIMLTEYTNSKNLRWQSTAFQLASIGQQLQLFECPFDNQHLSIGEICLSQRLPSIPPLSALHLTLAGSGKTDSLEKVD